MLRKSAKYHYNRLIWYSLYNMARRKKSLQRKNKKAEVGPFSFPLQTQTLVHLRVQQIQILFALCAVNMIPLRTYLLLGHFMHVNRNWILKMLLSWQIIREKAVYIGDNALVDRLMIGDVGSNSSFYQKRCSATLYNRFTKKNRKRNVRGKLVLTRWLHLWTRFDSGC